MLENGCLACDVLAGKIQAPGGVIYEDEYWMVDHSVSPVMLPGLLIIKPKRHCEHLAELVPQEMASFAQILRNTCIALSRAVEPAKVYACSFGETVLHVHFLVIPRLPGMSEHGLVVLDELFREKRWACSNDEAAQIAMKVRAEFRRLLQDSAKE